MTSVDKRYLMRLPLLAVVGGMLFSSPVADILPVGSMSAHAQENDKPERKTRKVVAMREKILKKIQEVQALLEDETVADSVKFPQARKMLDDVRGEKDLNSAELSTMWNFYAYLYLSQDDYPKAIGAYEKMIAIEDAEPRMITNIMYNLAQLYMATEQYQKSISTMNNWLKRTESPTPEAYLIIGQAYYQLENYKQSLPAIERAVNMAIEAGKEPKENWYQLLRALYYELNQKVKAKDILEILTSRYNKKDYWLQLSQIYGELQREDDQLSAIEVAYRAGYLDRGAELENLAQLFLYRGVPYKAAKVMEKGMNSGAIEKDEKNYETLSRAWLNSMEYKKALDPLGKAAAKSEDGELYLRLARVYTQLNEPKNAVEAVSNAIRKGDLKRTDDAYILKGMAEFELERYDSARNSFQNAAKSKRSEKMANNWIKYINNEQKRIMEIRKFLNN